MEKGIKSTEFWLTLGVNVAAILGTLSYIMPPKFAAYAMALSTGLYAISRGWVKGQDIRRGGQ